MFGVTELATSGSGPDETGSKQDWGAVTAMSNPLDMGLSENENATT